MTANLFSKTKSHLAEYGFRKVARMQGYDLTHPQVRSENTRKNQVVAKAFEHVFLPRARKAFDADARLDMFSGTVEVDS